MTQLAPAIRPVPLTPQAAWAGLPELCPDLERYLGPRCRDRHEREDALQESLLRAARYRAGLREPRRLKPWLLRIARNVWSDRLRQQRRRLVEPEAEFDLLGLVCPGPPPEELVEDPEEYFCFGRFEPKLRVLWALRLALARLQPAERGLLLAFALSTQPRGRVLGARFGLTPEQVKLRLFRARKRLRAGLERELSGLRRIAAERSADRGLRA
jgi:RNA polymerase sigma factor (sigma-70 family)